MTKTKAGPISADRLKSLIERIENLETERKAIGDDIRDIYSEAKGVGYDVKTMRKVVQLRKVDAADRDEQEALLDVYLHALGMVDRIEARAAAGESARQIAEAEGVSKSTAHRVAQKARAQVDNAEMGRAETGSATVVATGGEALSPRPLVRPLSPSTQTGEGEDSEVALRAQDERREPATQLATGNQAHEGEEDGHRDDSEREGCGSEGLQPKRQSGSGGHQGSDGIAGEQDGADPRPEQRAGGPRGGGGDHEHPDGQHVVRFGGDQGSVTPSPEVARVASPVACLVNDSPDPCPNTCAKEGRCAWDSADDNPISVFLRREKVA